MRSVAISLVLFLTVAAWPLALATNECIDSRCKAVDVPPRPSQLPSCSPVPLPAGIPPCVPPRFYIYHAAATCTDTACKGAPPAKVAGIIWEETNGLSGLQRLNENGVAHDAVLLL